MIKLDTAKKRQDAISSFANLLNSEGWKLVVQILDANIEVLVQQLESGGENETKEDVDRIRDNLKLTRDFRNTPQDMIKKLEAPVSEPQNPDPFDTVEDVQKRKGEAVDKEE